MKRKTILLFLVFCLTFSLSGCGIKDKIYEYKEQKQKELTQTISSKIKEKIIEETGISTEDQEKIENIIETIDKNIPEMENFNNLSKSEQEKVIFNLLYQVIDIENNPDLYKEILNIEDPLIFMDKIEELSTENPENLKSYNEIIKETLDKTDIDEKLISEIQKGIADIMG